MPGEFVSFVLPPEMAEAMGNSGVCKRSSEGLFYAARYFSDEGCLKPGALPYYFQETPALVARAHDLHEAAATRHVAEIVSGLRSRVTRNRPPSIARRLWNWARRRK